MKKKQFLKILLGCFFGFVFVTTGYSRRVVPPCYSPQICLHTAPNGTKIIGVKCELPDPNGPCLAKVECDQPHNND